MVDKLKRIVLEFKLKLRKTKKRLIELKDSVALNLKPDLEISEYAGKYTHQVYGDITLTEHKNKLTITFEHHSNLTATLESLGGNRFLCTYNDPAFGIKIFPFHIENKQVNKKKSSQKMGV